MANLKSSIKDIERNARNNDRNTSYKTRMKTYIKYAVLAIDKMEDDRLNKVQNTLRIIDITASKGVIKKQTAARKKSRLMLSLNKSLETQAKTSL